MYTMSTGNTAAPRAQPWHPGLVAFTVPRNTHPAAVAFLGGTKGGGVLASVSSLAADEHDEPRKAAASTALEDLDEQADHHQLSRFLLLSQNNQRADEAAAVLMVAVTDGNCSAVEWVDADVRDFGNPGIGVSVGGLEDRRASLHVTDGGDNQSHHEVYPHGFRTAADDGIIQKSQQLRGAHQHLANHWQKQQQEQQRQRQPAVSCGTGHDQEQLLPLHDECTVAEEDDDYDPIEDFDEPVRRGRHKGRVCSFRHCNKFARLTNTGLRRFCIQHMRQLGLTPKPYSCKRQGQQRARDQQREQLQERALQSMREDETRPQPAREPSQAPHHDGGAAEPLQLKALGGTAGRRLDDNDDRAAPGADTGTGDAIRAAAAGIHSDFDPAADGTESLPRSAHHPLAGSSSTLRMLIAAQHGQQEAERLEFVHSTPASVPVDKDLLTRNKRALDQTAALRSPHQQPLLHAATAAAQQLEEQRRPAASASLGSRMFKAKHTPVGGGSAQGSSAVGSSSGSSRPLLVPAAGHLLEPWTSQAGLLASWVERSSARGTSGAVAGAKAGTLVLQESDTQGAGPSGYYGYWESLASSCSSRNHRQGAGSMGRPDEQQAATAAPIAGTALMAAKSATAKSATAEAAHQQTILRLHLSEGSPLLADPPKRMRTATRGSRTLSASAREEGVRQWGDAVASGTPGGGSALAAGGVPDMVSGLMPRDVDTWDPATSAAETDAATPRPPVIDLAMSQMSAVVHLLCSVGQLGSSSPPPAVVLQAADPLPELLPAPPPPGTVRVLFQTSDRQILPGWIVDLASGDQFLQ